MACIFLLSVIYLLTFHPIIAQGNRQTYIVHVNSPGAQIPKEKFEEPESWYHSVLREATADRDGPSGIGHKYRNVISGFSAKLYPAEAEQISKMKGFLHIRPEKIYTLETTHSPKFLGLSQTLNTWPNSNYGKGVIIGVLDSGITPNHPSFSDKGVPPPPPKWKGKCEFKSSACNNKLIGARNFARDDPGPPIDRVGHGTHTSSTAAGNFVPNASTFGQANGTASGTSPLAHLVMYKVCTEETCHESDILAGMDAAIEDGVDVLSISLGGVSSDFYEDGLAIAAFVATEKGIFVSCSGGNRGPSRYSMSNEAPWILTAGASTMDREIVSTVLLGNRDEYDGQSLYQVNNFPPMLLALVYAEEFCAPRTLNNLDVKGKIVLCLRGGGIGRVTKGQTVKNAGGAAMILMNDKSDAYSTLADAHVLPAAHVSYSAGEQIKAYINSTSKPTATILFKGTVTGDKTAPTVASFSSRGPSSITPSILKPDIIGPGVSILAAWYTSVGKHTDKTGIGFNMLSGTSMSCPHLSGIAALIKSTHPNWSPAMIKSAIMTSATQSDLNKGRILDERNLPADVFAIGAGHVDPTRALDPGLVYDLSMDDYISYLCFMYTEKQVGIVVQRKVNCGQSKYKDVPEVQLNYPSFAVQLGDDSQNYSRTVTNVGEVKSTYRVQIENVPGVNVTVEPTVLAFSKVNQKKKYKISFNREECSTSGTYVQGSISWVSNKHVVRTPISVHLVVRGDK